MTGFDSDEEGKAVAHEVPLIHPVPIPISMVVSDVPLRILHELA